MPGALDPLRCQQSLEPLEQRGDALHAPGSGRTYPIHDGIVFMGYDRADQDFMELTMEEERAAQGTSNDVEGDLEYLRTQSGPSAVDALKALDELDLVQPGARTIDIGAGGGWETWLLAEAGFDAWMMDFEMNSVWIGASYEHPALPAGRRLVGDATLLPFADGTFDFAWSKEFAHHVPDKDRLWSEMNRVLKPGGIAVVVDPVRSVRLSIEERRHPDEHTGHSILWNAGYARGLQRNGFEVLHSGRQFEDRPARFGALRDLRRKATDAARAGRPFRDPRVWLYEHLVGGTGSLLLVLRKTGAPSRPRRPAEIEVVGPDRLRVDERDREQFRPIKDFLPQLAADLPRRGTAAATA
jgi:SAM-dependent methyltransferase